ncbi:aminotransferase [Halocynthiibacter sp.]|uniref:aminotransferase n=1 Tax=Halocynthiibacter sp. TaxID=1979210 RepID=UPI003C36C914
MVSPLNPRMAATFLPPVMEARRWLEGVEFPADRPLINVSQAAPVAPPPLALRQAIADAALNMDEAHLYGPVLGNDNLRDEIALRWSQSYKTTIKRDQVAITSGCNQAFAATLATIAGDADEVILPTPWYFNHKMWCDMQGVRAVPLATGDDLLPDPARAEALITDRTKAIALVSPNNPGGVEYPAELLQAFYDLCSRKGITLMLDETYRDFDSRCDGVSSAAHSLFDNPDWDQTLIHLYSFSKAFRLTGHRVGAFIASKSRLTEAEKFLDTVAICPNQLGQIAALWGLQNLTDWVLGERLEILDRAKAIREGFPKLPDWKLLGCGAYFAWVEHPFDLRSDQLAQQLVRDAGLLILPGTMFTPEGDNAGAKQLRIAFANIDRSGISDMFERLKNVS